MRFFHLRVHPPLATPMLPKASHQEAGEGVGSGGRGTYFNLPVGHGYYYCALAVAVSLRYVSMGRWDIDVLDCIECSVVW